MNKSDKRKMGRVSLELLAELSVINESKDKYSLKCSTSDICAKGAFFNTDVPVPVGTDMEIDLDLPLDELKDVKGNSARIKVSGVVVRTEEKGMAVSFSGLKVLSVDK